MRLQWSKDALHNLERQIDYIERENPDAATRLEQRVAQQLRLLLRYPESGRKGRLAGTRELVISHSPFLAVYRVRRNRIEVLRILHGAQQYPPGKSKR